MPTNFSALADKLATAVAVPVTPFAHGSVDLDAHASLLRRIVDGGITVVTPNGNTGEFYTLTPDERQALVDNTVKAVGADVDVLAGVGLDLPGATEAARHARDAGASMVMVHELAHPFVSPQGWLDYLRTIADAVPELGVVLYVRSTRVGAEELRQLGELCPNVIGVKYAVPDPMRFAGMVQDAGAERFVWLAGLAEMHAPSFWTWGARGFTSGIANVDPTVPMNLLNALRAGDSPAVAAIWRGVRAFEELRAADGSADNVAVVKEALAQLGLGQRDVRPPSRLLPQSKREDVARALEALRS
ncbi:dihydrodipicolinate synthase family protein [Actinopolymorpha pittospori]